MVKVQADRKGQRVRGSALVVAMLFMALFTGLVVAYLTFAGANLRSSRLYADSARAQAAAESGLAFMRLTLPSLNMQSAVTKAATLQAIASGLNSLYGGTLFGGQSAQVQGDHVILPAVILNFPEGQTSFRTRVHAISDTSYQIESLGSHGEAARTSCVDFLALRDTSLLANFGVASKSQIIMTGNAAIVGKNNASEGSVLSTTCLYMYAIGLQGSVEISGDASLVNPSGEVSMIGKCDIGGNTKIGVASPPFPTYDISPFGQYATNNITTSNPSGGGSYFENIRIKANTNPTFTSNTVIRGVIYIESPNVVTFGGNVDLTGLIVAEQPSGSLDLAHNAINFKGGVTSNSVTALPSCGQFDGLRSKSGSFLLAPGYAVTFGGNFSTINGTIAASQMDFSGNATGTIKGSVINDRDTRLTITGSSKITIDHAGLNDNPAGLIFPRKMAYVAGSYEE